MKISAIRSKGVRTVERLLHGLDKVMVPIIVLNVIEAMLETVETLRQVLHTEFRLFEQVSIVIFTIEYVARLVIILANSPRSFFKQVLSPLMIIDLIVILPFYLAMFSIHISWLRMVRIFRLFKLGRYTPAFNLFIDILYRKREELMVSFGLVLILVVVAASGIYYLEHPHQPEVFSSIPQALWWAIITITSVGYGDVVPATLGGKFLGGIVAVLGIGIFAIPTAFIAAGFIDHIQEEKAKKQPHEKAHGDLTKMACPHCGKPLHVHIQAEGPH